MAVSLVRGLASFVAVPWAVFVALFLYVVVLTLMAIGASQLSDGFMAVAYGAPVAAYGLLLVARLARAIGALGVHFGHALPQHALTR